MITVDIPAALDRALQPFRSPGRIGFVPTMGNLHEGHLTLVREARSRVDHVVVSIFVNPLQFGDGEDYAGYPRTLDQDSRLLEDEGVDTLFAPSVAVMYPKSRAETTRVEVPLISNLLCGASRPGHFSGVATVVARLFNLVRPDVAFFGQKDYQQLMVIRRMTEDLAFPIEIVGVPTVREADGLAMSSRNGYLTADERDQAPALYAALQAAAVALADGAAPDEAERTCRAWIDAAGLRTDYVAVRRKRDLLMPQPDDRDLVILAAAWLGKARLIDNLEVDR